MNISAILEKAWNDVSKAGLAGHTLNESVIGFQLCQTIREQHPELNLSLDCRRADDECEQVGTPQISDRGHVSTLVISTPGDDARVLFIGKLMPSGPAVLHASQVIAELREDFKRKETSVLTRDAQSGGYTGQQVPLSQTCAFGLFVLPGDDSARIRYESFTGELDRDERARFHLAYSVPGNDVGSPRTFRFQAPKESIRIPMENTYPDLVVRLDNGRELRADALTWEPSYEQTIDINDGGNSRKLVIQRMRLRADELFNNRRFHYIEPQPFEGDPIRLPNTCVFAWLSSDPMSRKSVYSELVVMFFVEFRKNTTLEQLLWEGVHDLDWEAHAEDVDEKTVALWKQAWLTKTVH